MSAPGPYAPGTAVPPVDYAKKAANIQLMGILSIVFAFCCGCVGLILSIVVLVQAPTTLAMLQQVGSPPELVSKVNTGKTCAIIGLALAVLFMIIGVVAQLAGVMAQRGG